MKKTILIVVIAILAVAGSVLGTLYATGNLFGDKADAAAVASEDASPAAATASKNVSYVSLDPAFTMSFPESDIAQFLQINVDVAVQDKETEEALHTHAPAVRNGLVMLLSTQKAEELQTREGKERLRGEILAEVRQILTALTGKTGAVDVYFTSFLIQ